MVVIVVVIVVVVVVEWKASAFHRTLYTVICHQK